MANPWPKFITPNMDPVPMRRDAPKPSAPSAPTPRRQVPRPTDFVGPTAEVCQAVIDASTDGEGNAKPGYALRVRNARAILARLTAGVHTG